MPHCAVAEWPPRGGIGKRNPSIAGDGPRHFPLAGRSSPVVPPRVCTARQRLGAPGGVMAWQFSTMEFGKPEGGLTMRRIAFVLISAVATVVMAASAALADSPHFIFADNSINSSTGALVTSFKDAGLGTGTTSIAITLKANASATYQCYNKAGNKP